MAKFVQIWTEDQRKKEIKANIRKIKQSLKSADPEILKINAQLIEEAATYAANLKEINALINRDGMVDYYQNGKDQWGTKKSVAAELKPKYTQTYQSLVKQLSGLLPSENETSAAAELMEFLGR